MNQKDEQALASIRYTAAQDALTREDIKRAIDSHDRAFFAQVVSRVIDRLHLSIPDVRGFTERAYEWFKDQQQKQYSRNK